MQRCRCLGVAEEGSCDFLRMHLPAPYLLRNTAALWVVFNAPLWGHLEKDKRKRHQKVVRAAACLHTGFLLTQSCCVQPTANKPELESGKALLLSSSNCLSVGGKQAGEKGVTYTTQNKRPHFLPGSYRPASPHLSLWEWRS